jgi:4a-hydroxytetrahydrobiopterin dehydratase
MFEILSGSEPYDGNPLSNALNQSTEERMEKLSGEAIEERLGRAPGWSVVNGMLHKEYTFKDFARAFSFLTRAALVSERLNHHANIWNCYNRVVFDINTHDANGITEKDFRWIELVERGLENV